MGLDVSLHIKRAENELGPAKGAQTKPPEIHKKTYDEFKKRFVDTGMLDVELLKIYKSMIVRADELLFLFRTEKRKRGKFTYQTIAQANVLEVAMKNKNPEVYRL